MKLHSEFDFLPKPTLKLDLDEFNEHKQPKISAKTLKRLIKQANRFQKLEPWKNVEESDIFGIRDPKTGALYLISVFGGDGDVFSLHCHMPPEGVVFWQNAFRGVEQSPGLTDMRLLECNFEQEGLAAEEDIAIYKQHSLKSEAGKLVPCFRSYQPGFYPWFLEAKEAEQLIMVFELFFRFYTEIFSKKEKFYQWENPFGEMPGIPVFYIEGESEAKEVEDWSIKMEVLPEACLAPLKIRPEADLQIKAFETLPIHEETWEIGSFFMPTPVFNGDRPYYPKSAICLRASEVASRCPLDPFIYGGNSGPDDVEVIRYVFKQLVSHCKYLPEQVRVDSDVALAALEFYGDELGIEITNDEQLLMPVLVSEIISSLEETDRRWDEVLLDEVVQAIPPEFHRQPQGESLTGSVQKIANVLTNDEEDPFTASPENVIRGEFGVAKKASGDGVE